MYLRYWKSISLLALGVGTSSFFLWRHLHKKTRLEYIKKNTFTIDRIIDADCFGQVLYIGVNGYENPNFQGIRLGGEGEIYKLLKCTRYENKLQYEFENNITLFIYMTEQKDLYYSLEFVGTHHILIENKVIDNKVRESWKTISMGSKDLDELLQLK
jgi:hypothetical protein